MSACARQRGSGWGGTGSGRRGRPRGGRGGRDPSNLIWVIPAKGTRWTGDGRAQPGSGRLVFGQERPMTIMVNGRPMDVTDGVSVEALLAQLGVKREYTAVALNREVMPKSRYAETILKQGDRVEIVRPMGGG